MSTSNMVEMVDDMDPRVTYIGPWFLGGVMEEFDQTTHGTSKNGSQVEFTFTGNWVAVYGTIAAQKPAPVSIYSIDGSSSRIFNSTPPSTVLHRQLFYRSPVLSTSLSQHVLTITSLVPNSTFWLDYFEVGVDQSSVTRKVPPDVPISKGVIAGAAVGSAMMVILTGIAIWLYFRNKARRRSSSGTHTIQPFSYSNVEWAHPLLNPEQNLGGDSVPNHRLQFITRSSDKREEIQQGLRAMARRHSRTSEILYHGLLPEQTGGNQHHSGSPIPPHTVGVIESPPPRYDTLQT